LTIRTDDLCGRHRQAAAELLAASSCTVQRPRRPGSTWPLAADGDGGANVVRGLRDARGGALDPGVLDPARGLPDELLGDLASVAGIGLQTLVLDPSHRGVAAGATGARADCRKLL
jgi:hypothetical protein